MIRRLRALADFQRVGLAGAVLAVIGLVALAGGDPDTASLALAGGAFVVAAGAWLKG